MGSPLEQLKQPSPKAGRFAGLEQSTAPDNSVLLTTVKSHLRITSSAEDTLLQLYIDGAVRTVEQLARRSLLDQSWTLTLDSFPATDYIDLYMGPLVSITSLTTYDDNNDPSTAFSDYALDTAGERLLLDDGATWPTDLRSRASVKLEYATGYGATVADLPGTLLRAVLMMAGDFYANRDVSCSMSAETAYGVSTLLGTERRWRL